MFLRKVIFMANDNIYISVEKASTAEITEKKSRFIANIIHAETEDEVNAFIEKIRKEHYSARHNVYAYILSNGVKKYTDDGEPSKTGGFPILEMLEKQGITDVVCVVTRYFGGTLLGTGGLIRAYTEAAKQGLIASGTVTMKKCELIELTLSYANLGSVEHLLKKHGAVCEDKSYAENITLTVSIDSSFANNLTESIKNDFANNVEIYPKGQVYRKI